MIKIHSIAMRCGIGEQEAALLVLNRQDMSGKLLPRCGSEQGHIKRAICRNHPELGKASAFGRAYSLALFLKPHGFASFCEVSSDRASMKNITISIALGAAGGKPSGRALL